MGKCGKCRSNIGFFGSTKPCSNANCDYEECISCYESKNSNLKSCKICGDFLCPKHFEKSKHLCEEKEKVEDDAETEEESPIENIGYSIKISQQDGNLIEFNELSKLQAETLYNDIKRALTSGQIWYELDLQKHFGKEVYSFEKIMLNLNQITNFKIEGE